MKKTIKSPTEPHRVFAWLPVLTFDRDTGSANVIWLSFVMRSLISIQGQVMWKYEECK